MRDEDVAEEGKGAERILHALLQVVVRYYFFCSYGTSTIYSKYVL